MMIIRLYLILVHIIIRILHFPVNHTSYNLKVESGKLESHDIKQIKKKLKLKLTFTLNTSTRYAKTHFMKFKMPIKHFGY